MTDSEPLHVYVSFAARAQAVERLLDAAGKGRPVAAVWTENHLTWVEFIGLMERVLPVPGEESGTPREGGGNGGAGRRRPRFLSEAARGAVLFSVFRALTRNKAAAERYAAFASPAALRVLGRTAGEWRSAGISPDLMRAAARRAAAERRKHPATALTLAAELRAAYEKRLGKKWTDRELREAELLDRLAVAGPLQLPPLIFHGLLRPALFQRRLLEGLQARGVSLEIEPAAGAAAGASFGRLASALRPAVVEPPRGIARVEAGGLYEELYEVGRRVRRWLREEKVPPAEICLVCRDWGPYGEMPTNVLRRLGIPYRERRGEPLALSPLTRAALSALHAVVGGLRAADVFRFLCAGVVDADALFRASGEKNGTAAAAVKEQEDSPTPPADRSLPEILFHLGPDGKISAAELWRTVRWARLVGLYGEEERDPAAAWRTRLERYAERREREGGKKEAARAREAAWLLALVVGRLAELRRPRPRREFAEELRRLWADAGLSAAGWFQRVREETDEVVPTESPARARRRKLRECRVFAELEAVLAAAAEGPGGESEAMPAEEFLELLRLETAERSVRTGETVSGGDGVRLLNIYDLRGLRFSRVAALGFQDGSFPAAPEPHPVFSAEEAAAVRELFAAGAPEMAPLDGLEPRTPAELTEEERRLPRLLLEAAAAGELTVTRSRTDVLGNIAPPSVFWETSPFADAPCTRAESVRPAPPLRACLTAEEAELRAAWLLGDGPSPPDEAAAPAEKKAAAEHTLERVAAAALLREDAGRLRNLAAVAAREYGRNILLDTYALRPEAPPPEERAAAAAWCGVPAAVAGETTREIRRLLLSTAEQPAPLLSVGALEKLAQCPFRFFGERLMRLRSVEDEPDEMEPSPLDRGSLLHAATARFLGERLKESAAAGHLTAEWRPELRAELRQRLRRTAETVWREAVNGGFGGPPPLVPLHYARFLEELDGWLEYELAATETAAATTGALCFQPARVELAFGDGRRRRTPDGGLPLSPLVLPYRPAGTSGAGEELLRFSGRIDRLDVALDNAAAATPRVLAVRVLDYKTSDVRELKKRVKAEVLRSLASAQLPLYLAAAWEWLREEERRRRLTVDWAAVTERSSAAFVSLRRSAVGKSSAVEAEWPGSLKTFLPVPCSVEEKRTGNDGAGAADAAETLISLVSERVRRALGEGFPVAPAECGGVFCPLCYVCGYKEAAPGTEGGATAAEGGAAAAERGVT